MFKGTSGQAEPVSTTVCADTDRQKDHCGIISCPFLLVSTSSGYLTIFLVYIIIVLIAVCMLKRFSFTFCLSDHTGGYRRLPYWG